MTACAVCQTTTAVVTVADPAGNTADVCGPCWRRLEQRLNGLAVVAIAQKRRTK